MMGRVSINRETGTETDATSVSNVFIDEYMTDANDAQLKIYLYLLRMMRADLSTSLNDLADRFNLTEKDVMRALKFWEKRGIVTMEYDHSKHLTGIHLEDLTRVREEVEQPASDAVSPAAPPEHVPGEDCSQILFIAERYLGRPLSVSDTKSLLYIHDTLAFSDALLDYLLQYCVERGKTDFRYMERVAVRWKESGYETPEQARRGTFKYDKRVYEVMDLLGLTNVPTETEAAFVQRWISEYHLGVEIIREACARTVLATQKRRLEYADRILRSWHEAGVAKKSDIKQLDEAHEADREAKRAAGGTKPSGSSGAQIRSFPQRDYDFGELEKQLIRNS